MAKPKFKDTQVIDKHKGHDFRMNGDVSQCRHCNTFLGLWDGIKKCTSRATATLKVALPPNYITVEKAARYLGCSNMALTTADWHYRHYKNKQGSRYPDGITDLLDNRGKPTGQVKPTSNEGCDRIYRAAQEALAENAHVDGLDVEIKQFFKQMQTKKGFASWAKHLADEGITLVKELPANDTN